MRAKLNLPFPLTGAQRRSISEIEGDMAQAAPMLRLLQGDVGSGKTVVALESMLVAVEAEAQAALLAPTEILARQHHETLSRMLSGTGVTIALLTGRDNRDLVTASQLRNAAVVAGAVLFQAVHAPLGELAGLRARRR